jgi:SAM-dependent methyltransferase
MKINDNYVADAPAPENAVKLFSGRWSSRIPGFEAVSGDIPLFQDHRIQWWMDHRGDWFDGQSVLELGPLESGHTHMLTSAGASVLGIEASSEAFLKSLVVKEVLGLDRVRFLLGDFDQFLETTDQRFDAVLACGVLYHMHDPLQTLQNIIRVTDEVFIWSHFFVESAMPLGDNRRRFFTEDVVVRERNGETMTYHPQIYPEDTTTVGFIGGVLSGSSWVDRDEVVALFERHGFVVSVTHVHDEHPNGPAASLHARRPR